MPLIFPAALHFFVLLRTAAAAGAPHVCTAVCDRHGSNESTVQTSCLQSALDRCHLLASTAGVPAVLLLPAGTYHTGSIVVPSNTTLRMASGATLLGSTDSADYPLVEALPGYGVPRDCCCNDWDRYNCSGLGVGVPPAYIQRHRALLTTVRGATDVAIEGAGGQSSVVDGQGWPWWWKFEQLGLTAGRPHLVEPMFVTGFRIEGIWLKDSPFWTLHPYACDDVVIRNMIITADAKRGHNTDGIDPDSCSRVLVEGCYVRVGDDAVAIKSGIDYAGRRFGRPSQHMLFRNCTFASKHVSIGSEESGGVRNITVEDCILGAPSGPHNSAPFDGFSPGIHLKAERGRGGFIRDITLRRLSFLGPVSQPLFVSMFYSDARNRTNATATPQFSNITMEDLIVHSAVVTDRLRSRDDGARDHHAPAHGWAGSLVGLPEAPITGLTLRNVTVKLATARAAASSTSASQLVAKPWLCADIGSGSATGVTPPLPSDCFSSQAPSHRTPTS